MKSLIPALALLALCACDPGGPNGRDGVLQFNLVPYGVVVGETGTVELPHQIRRGDYWMTKAPVYYRKRTFRWDFAGTTLDVQLPATAELTGTELADGDWLITYRCVASGAGDLTVRVMSGGSARYADSTWLGCY